MVNAQWLQKKGEETCFIMLWNDFGTMVLFLIAEYCKSSVWMDWASLTILQRFCYKDSALSSIKVHLHSSTPEGGKYFPLHKRKKRVFFMSPLAVFEKSSENLHFYFLKWWKFYAKKLRFFVFLFTCKKQNKMVLLVGFLTVWTNGGVL